MNFFLLNEDLELLSKLLIFPVRLDYKLLGFVLDMFCTGMTLLHWILTVKHGL